jgi:hypothetical protein
MLLHHLVALSALTRLSGCFEGPSILGVFERIWNFYGKKGIKCHLESRLSQITVLVIHGWLCMNLGLILAQTAPPGHSGKETQVDLNERGIYPVFRPAFYLI